MNNALKQITLPTTGYTVEIRQWITAGQALHARAALLENAVFTAQGDDVKLSRDGFSGQGLQENKLRTIEAYVASVNGQTVDIRKSIMDLPEEDFDFLSVIIDEHREEINKKKSSSSPQS